MPCPPIGGIYITTGAITVLPISFSFCIPRKLTETTPFRIGRLKGSIIATRYAGTACRAPTDWFLPNAGMRWILIGGDYITTGEILTLPRIPFLFSSVVNYVHLSAGGSVRIAAVVSGGRVEHCVCEFTLLGSKITLDLNSLHQHALALFCA